MAELAGTFIAAGLPLYTRAAGAAIEYKIVTASDKGTYFKIGADLAKFVAPDAGIGLKVLPTSGSAANIKHLRYDPGVKFAIVQADVYQAQSAGHGRLPRPLRAIAVPEFFHAAGARASQMARSQSEPAQARSGLDVLWSYDPGDPRLPRQGPAGEIGRTAVPGGGAYSGTVQLARGFVRAARRRSHHLPARGSRSADPTRRTGAKRSSHPKSAAIAVASEPPVSSVIHRSAFSKRSRSVGSRAFTMTHSRRGS